MTTFAIETEVRKQTNKDDLRDYNELTKFSDQLVTKTEEWIADAQLLDNRVIDPEKKDELLALKQSLMIRLKAILK